jgi:5S rRNA maturation endonuclease (ribonuclease M5)
MLIIKKDDTLKITASGEPIIVLIDPDIKTEISRSQIEGIVADMKKHLSKKKKCHIVLVRE